MGRVSAKVSHPRCPYCHDEVMPPDAKEACNGCMSWQHAACWDELSRCAACQRARDVAKGGPAKGLKYYTFSSNWNSWESLFEEAAEYASSKGQAAVFSISHSADASDGVVTVWYWGSRAPFLKEPTRKLRFQVYRSRWDSWDELYKKAATFASSLDTNDVLGISHSADSSDGVVTVWYWR
jgi:hypothetical protein